MARLTETLALRLVWALYVTTGGELQAWRSLEDLTASIVDADAAVQLAVGEGWLLVEGGHSVCLTDAGRRLAAR